MRLSTKIAYNTIVQLISKVISTAVGLAAIAIMTRYLGKTGFGEYTTVTTFLSFFAVAADLGLTLVTVQLISQPGANQEKSLNNLFGLRLITAVAMMSLAPLVVIFFPYNQSIKIGVTIAAVSFVFAALNQIMVGLFQKTLRMDKAAIAELASRLVLLLGVFLAYRYQLGLNGILWATVFSSLVSFLLHYLMSREFSFIRPEFDPSVWREITAKAWPLAITIFFNLIYLRTDTLVLSLIKTQAEVGLYGAAYRIIDVLITVPFIFAGLVLPVLTSSWANKKTSDFNNVLQKSLDLMIVLAVPLTVGTIFLSTPLISLIAGNEFLAAGKILNILIFATGIIFIGCIFSHAIIALGLQKKIIPAYIFTALTSVAGYLVFIPKYSYLGAAWVTVYSELAIAFFAFWLVWRSSKFLPDWSLLIKSFSAAAVMGLFLFWLQNLEHKTNFFLAVFLSALIYFLMLFVFRGLKRSDLNILLNK